MMPQSDYTLEGIQAERDKLSLEIKKKETAIRQKWAGIVAPPPAENRFQQWTNRAEAAFSVYDGFMTGYKLLRLFGVFFRRGKKKTAR